MRATGRHRWGAVVLALALCGMPACGSDGGGGGAAGSSGGAAGSSGGGAGSAGAAAAYPPGPYGSEVGDVVANHAFEGYVNEAGDALSTTKPYLAAWTLDDLRKSGRPYAVVHVSEFF